VILLLVPPGRGRWAPLQLHVPAQRLRHLLPITTKPGDRITIDGRPYRVSRVQG
jgi:hypothetical protein